MDQLIKNLRSDLKTPRLPFIAGQIYGKGGVNNDIRNLPKRVPNTGCATKEGLTVFDNVHFDHKSQQILGARYADVYLRLSGQKP